MTNERLSRAACLTVGGLLVLESLAMTCLAWFVAIIGSLAGALAFGVGGGAATNEQMADGFAVIAVTIGSPFVVAAVLGLGGVLLLLRKRRFVVITAGVVAIIAQGAFHVLCKEGLHALDAIPCAVNLLAIAVGFAFVPAIGNEAVATATHT